MSSRRKPDPDAVLAQPWTVVAASGDRGGGSGGSGGAFCCCWLRLSRQTQMLWRVVLAIFGAGALYHGALGLARQCGDT